MWYTYIIKGKEKVFIMKKYYVDFGAIFAIPANSVTEASFKVTKMLHDAKDIYVEDYYKEEFFGTDEKIDVEEHNRMYEEYLREEKMK